MNLAVHGIDGNLGDRADSTFTPDLHPDLRADYIITNPPFNLGEKDKSADKWGRNQLLEDPRWKVDGKVLLPPESNANYAWIQHFLYHLAPDGYAGFVLANGALSNVNRSEELVIRQALVAAGVIDCIVSLPNKLFANTKIPVCLWFVGKNREGTEKFRARTDETLFIDARKLGRLVSRNDRVLTAEDLGRISGAYHAFRSKQPGTPYADVDGFCRKASRSDIEKRGFVLTPGRYVGTPEAEEDDIPAAESLAQIKMKLLEEFDKSTATENHLRELLNRVVDDA